MLRSINRKKEGDLDTKIERILKETQEKATKKEEETKDQASRLIEDAKEQGENIKRKKMLEAKEHWIQKKTEFEAKTLKREQTVKASELTQKEKENELKMKEKDLQRIGKENDKIKERKTKKE